MILARYHCKLSADTAIKDPNPEKERILGEMTDLNQKFDVLVIGGGNAALCAAISARLEGASVLVLERAKKFYRGGNTRHTRNMRCAHDEATDTLTGPYPEDELFEDLLRVTEGETDEELARHMIHESKDMLDWIVEQGVKFQPPLGGTLGLGRTNSFFLGGGRAMLNALYNTADRIGVTVQYEAEVTALDIQDGMFVSATARIDGKDLNIRAGALVAAAGGFESNIDWLKKYWGEAARNFLIRGTANNQGSVLKMILDAGVLSSGAHTISLEVLDDLGESCSSSISIIVNSPPSAPTVTISPNPANTTDDLSVTASGSQDPDNNTISCFHGITYKPPMNLRRGELVNGKWGFSKTANKSFGTFSYFVRHRPSQQEIIQRRLYNLV